MAETINNPAHEQMAKLARRHFLQSIEVKEATAENCSEDIAHAASILIGCLKTGGKILLCGNGGSAAD